MVHPSDLDLAYNRFSGDIPPRSLPRSLERLDISGNGFERLDGLTEGNAGLTLQAVNASRNCLRVIG